MFSVRSSHLPDRTLSAHGRWIAVVALITLPGSLAVAQDKHLNPTIDLLAHKKPVFGLYAPANPRTRPGQAPAPNAPPPKTPAQLSQEALAYAGGDFVFDGSMEGNFEPAFASF